MSAYGRYRSIRVSWLNHATRDLASTEVWSATVNNRSTAVIIAQPTSHPGVVQTYTHQNIIPGTTRYYWVRPVDASGNLGAFSPVSPTGGLSATSTNIPTQDVRLTWNEITATSADMVTQNGYIANNAALVSLRLPPTAALGDVIPIVGKGAGGWTITQRTGQSIKYGNTTTTVGTGGSFPGGSQYASLTLVCIVADLTWVAVRRLIPQGKLLGRGASSGSGEDEDITLGTGLSMSGTTLSASGTSTQGRHTIYVDAAAMTPATTLGAAGIQLEMATNKNALRALAFADVGTKLYSHFKLAFPKAWNLSTLTYRVHWTLNSTSTNSALFGLQAVATSDGDALDAAYGTAIEVTDNGLGSAAYKQHLSAESAALTVSGTPAAADLVDFRVYRDPTSDSFAGTVYMLGIEVFYTTIADTDT